MIPMHAEDAAALARELRSAGLTALADRLEALGHSRAARDFRRTAEFVAELLAAVGQRQSAATGDVLRQWMPELIAKSGSEAIVGLADQARGLLVSRELAEALASAHPKALEAREKLERMAALKSRADEMRRFEESAAKLESRCKGNWDGLGADLLRRFGIR